MNPLYTDTRFNAKAMAVIFLVHFTGDFYQSFFPPLYPLIKDRLDLSLTQIGLLAGVVTLAAFVAQPIAGLLADRFSARRYMIGGLVLSTVFIPLLGITPWFSAVVFLAGLGSLGSAIYHPTAAGLVPEFAGQRTGLGMSIFGLGGTLAHSLGPLAVTGFIVMLGFGRLPLTSFLGLAVIGLLFICLPKPVASRRAPDEPGRPFTKDLYATWKAVFILWLIAALRALTDVAIRSFYPILYMADGRSLVSVGIVLSLYTAGASLSALICGAVVDRYGYKPLFYFSFTLATPCLLLFLYGSGFWVYPLSFLAGFILLATMFPSIALATRIVSVNNRSLASSITLGFAVGSGGMLAPLVGQLSEHFGLLTVMSFTVLFPWLCLPLIHLIPEDRVPDRLGRH